MYISTLFETMKILLTLIGASLLSLGISAAEPTCSASATEETRGRSQDLFPQKVRSRRAGQM